MRSFGRNSGLILVASCLLFGCAATDKRFGEEQWYQKTRQVTDKVANLTKSTATASYKRMQKYVEQKDLLKTFHDTGEHSEAAVLDVLHRAGIGKGPATTGKTPAAPGATTPQVAKGPKAAPLPSRIPEQYSGDYRWPLDAGIISSEYGERWGKMHKGLDIAADTGEPVYAVAAGEVIYAGDGLRGYGNVIIVKHDSKVTSLYAHNSELKAKQGDIVKKGDLIALLGSTGRSTGPHVHFEFRQGEIAVDPHALLPKSNTPDGVPTQVAGTRQAHDPAS